ncbi:hypothetical protein [uncultured Litoreibacter sp.]|uniref:hypothetical protein n=1 Tax=uncultured Litoreibacter sp. TaxID=1392394 RepID=UPI00260E444D|nr:hypothetical protein [uncultured Litoreibacter sp.]
MADGNPQTPSPGAIAAQAQAGAPASQGEMGRICLPCSGQVMVEACYLDAWNTPLTDACVKVEDSTGIVVDGAIRTEPLAAHGQKDGDAPTAPLVTMGTTPLIEVAHGITDVSLIPQGAGEADSGMAELGTALTAFRDGALTKLRPYVAEWEQKGLLSIPEARLRGVGKGLSSWYEGEASFWGGVSEKAISAYQSAQNWHDAYVARQSPLEQGLLKWGGPLGAMVVYGTSLGESAVESVSEWIGGIGDLSDYIDIIMAAIRNLASGTVDLMEAALDTLRDLPGDLGKLFAQLIDNGQDWIEAMVLIASETNAFEYVFHIVMAVAMNMVPNFWSEMVGVVTGFILPEVLIEIILAVIAALTVGGGSVLVAGRLATFVIKLRGLAVKAKSLGVLADILEAFGKAITALAKIGKGLHDEIEAMTRAGADGVARIRLRLRQYKLEVDQNTLGMNGGPIRLRRKINLSRHRAPGVDELDQRRVRQFTANNEQGGKPDMAEGIGSARYEGLQGRQMQNSTTEGFDIVDGDTNVQLKGPLVNKKTGELLSINDQMVEGLADAVIHDATSNVASSRLVVDTLGMTPAQRNSLVSRITDGLANTPHLGKEIIILE